MPGRPLENMANAQKIWHLYGNFVYMYESFIWQNLKNMAFAIYTIYGNLATLGAIKYFICLKKHTFIIN
jgi:hypothetical protein